MKAFITSSGAHLPETVVSNDQLSEKLGLTPEQIFKSSGIRERRWAIRGETTSELAAKALTASGASPAEIEYLLLGPIDSFPVRRLQFKHRSVSARFHVLIFELLVVTRSTVYNSPRHW